MVLFSFLPSPSSSLICGDKHLCCLFKLQETRELKRGERLLSVTTQSRPPGVLSPSHIQYGKMNKAIEQIRIVRVENIDLHSSNPALFTLQVPGSIYSLNIHRKS